MQWHDHMGDDKKVVTLHGGPLGGQRMVNVLVEKTGALLEVDWGAAEYRAVEWDNEWAFVGLSNGRPEARVQDSLWVWV